MTSSNANRRAWEPTMMLAPNLEEIFLNKWVELTSQHKITHADVCKSTCVCECVCVCVRVCVTVCACIMCTIYICNTQYIAECSLTFQHCFQMLHSAHGGVSLGQRRATAVQHYLHSQCCLQNTCLLGAPPMNR